MSDEQKAQDKAQEDPQAPALEVLYVTMTEARRTFKEITDRAAAGDIVVITKQGIPFLQLVPLKFQVQQSTGGILTTEPIGAVALAE